jgi:hypothetical protein
MGPAAEPDRREGLGPAARPARRRPAWARGPDAPRPLPPLIAAP